MWDLVENQNVGFLMTRLMYISRGTTYASFCCQFFRIFEIKLLCFVVAMSDLVHDVKAMHGLY